MAEGTSAHKSGKWLADKRLESWKEIAAYLGREVRTIQRWEKSDALPIHRLYHAKRCTVYAFTRELDEWWESRRNILAESPDGESPEPEDTEAALPEPTKAGEPERVERRAVNRLAIPGIAVLVLAAGLAGWILRSDFDRGRASVTQ